VFPKCKISIPEIKFHKVSGFPFQNSKPYLLIIDPQMAFWSFRYMMGARNNCL